MSTGNLPDRAGHLIDLRRADEAIALLTQHLAAQPDDAYALCELARAHLARSDYVEAGRAADAAVGAAPDREWAHRLASIAAVGRGDHANAVAHAQEAARLEPENWQARHTLSRALLGAKKNRPAHEQARIAVDLAPLEAQAHLQLSVAAEACRYRGESDAALRRALELDPLDSHALHIKAAREVGKGRLGRGARSIIGALRLDPQSELGHENLASLMTALLVRLYTVTVLCGLVVAVLLFVGLEGHISPYWPRAAAGLLFIGLVGGVAWLTLRHVPPATRRHLAALPRTWRGRWLVAPAIFGIAAVCLMLTAFLPSNVALFGGFALLALVRLGQLVFLVWLVVVVVRAVGRLLRRR